MYVVGRGRWGRVTRLTCPVYSLFNYFLSAAYARRQHGFTADFAVDAAVSSLIASNIPTKTNYCLCGIFSCSSECRKSPDDVFTHMNIVLKMAAPCCRQGSNALNKTLLGKINDDGRIHLIPSECKGLYFLRFAVCATRTEPEDVNFAWSVIVELAENLLRSQSSTS